MKETAKAKIARLEMENLRLQNDVDFRSVQQWLSRPAPGQGYADPFEALERLGKQLNIKMEPYI